MRMRLDKKGTDPQRIPMDICKHSKRLLGVTRPTLAIAVVMFTFACGGGGDSRSTGPKSSLTVTGQVIGFGPIAGDFNFKQGDTIRIGIRATSNKSIVYVGIQYGTSRPFATVSTPRSRIRLT